MRITQKHGVQANELQRKRRFTIRTKIMILSVSVAMIPLILSFFISASISMKNGRTDAYALVEDRTDNVASQVSAYVNQGYAVVQGLSYSSDICGLDPEMQSRILAQTVENNPALVLLYQQDLNGMQTARSSGELGSRADRWWFQQEIATRKPFVTKSYYSRTTQEAVTSIIFPVWGEKQQLIGILGADFGLTELQEIVDAYNTEEVHTIILDGEGSVIAHIDRTEVENIYNYVTATKTIR